MNQVKEWIKSIKDKGFLCRDYDKRIELASNKEDLFKIVCDPNGISFIQNLKEQGIEIPIEMLKSKFKNFINGKVKPEYGDKSDISYNSSLYLDCKEKSITIDTTLASIISYKGEVYIPNNVSTTICIDGDSDISFVLGMYAFLRLNIYGDGKYNIIGDQTRVKVKRK